MRMKLNGEWRDVEVRYMEKQTEDYSPDYKDEWDCDRVILENLSRIGKTGETAYVRVTPVNDAQYRTRVPWTIGSGVKKSLLSEKHYGWILAKNPEVKLSRTNV